MIPCKPSITAVAMSALIAIVALVDPNASCAVAATAGPTCRSVGTVAVTGDRLHIEDHGALPPLMTHSG